MSVSISNGVNMHNYLSRLNTGNKLKTNKQKLLNRFIRDQEICGLRDAIPERQRADVSPGNLMSKSLELRHKSA